MRALPPRTYKANPRAEHKVIPFGVSHPAKMSAALCRDLFLRYTRPGDVVLDPFGGRGTSLVGITLGRNVILNELEPKFVEYIRQNEDHLRRHTLPGVALGWADIHQGDSRHLDWLPSADAVFSSPPYAEACTYQQAGAGGEHWELLRAGYTPEQIAEMRRASDPRVTQTRRDAGYSRSAENIGNLPHVDCAISSPPYADVCERNRTEEPYSQQQDPALKAKYGTGDTNRHVDGYGSTQGQIGALPHAAITSPPYGNTFSDWDVTSNAAREGQSVMYADERHTGPRVNIGNIPYYDDGHSSKRSPAPPEGAETYATACMTVYRECYRVIRPGGVLVLVTGNYVRDGRIIDLAADTIALAQAAGWTPLERWRHEKATVSFWRRLHHRQGRPAVTHEDVLVFCKGEKPAWDFAELPPTRCAPATLARAETDGETGTVTLRQMDLFSYQAEAEPST